MKLKKVVRAAPGPPGSFLSPPAPTTPQRPQIDDRKVWIAVDSLAKAKDAAGTKELITELQSLDADRAENLLQLIKMKHPDLYRLLRELDGESAGSSYTTTVVDNAVLNNTVGSARAATTEKTVMKTRSKKTSTTAPTTTALAKARKKHSSRLAGIPEIDRYVLAAGDDDDDDKPSFMTDPEEEGEMGEEGEGMLDLDALDLDLGDLDLPGEEGEEGEEEGEECGCPEGTEMECVPVEEEDSEEDEGEEEGEDEEGGEEDEGEEEGEDEEGGEEDEGEGEKKGAGFMVQRLLTERELEALRDANFDLILFGADTDDPHYAVFANGYPVAEIRQGDQSNLRGDFRDLFLRESYAEVVKDHIRAMGVVDTLRGAKARFYAAAAFEGEVAEKLKIQVEASMQEEQHQKLAELKERLLNVTAMVLEGSIKNYFGENQLKYALQAKMRRLGITENVATDVIEAAWREAAPAYFEEVLNRADSLLGAHPDVLKHHAEEIAQRPWTHPGYANSDELEVRASAETATSTDIVPRSVPVVSGEVPPMRPAPRAASARGQGWNKEYWRNKLKLSAKFISPSSGDAEGLMQKLGQLKRS